MSPVQLTAPHSKYETSEIFVDNCNAQLDVNVVSTVKIFFSILTSVFLPRISIILPWFKFSKIFKIPRIKVLMGCMILGIISDIQAIIFHLIQASLTLCEAMRIVVYFPSMTSSRHGW